MAGGRAELANAYYGTQKEVTSGSIYKFTWLNVTVNPAEETTQAKRKAGEIDDNTYCFAVRVEFTAGERQRAAKRHGGQHRQMREPRRA